MNATPLADMFFNGAQIRVPKTGACAESPDVPGSWPVATMHTDALHDARQFAVTGRAMAASSELLAALWNLRRCMLAQDLASQDARPSEADYLECMAAAKTVLDKVLGEGSSAVVANPAQELWAVMAPCGQGVLFDNKMDARWTLTGKGTGADGFGYPTIGEAFRECYAPALTLHRVVLMAQEGGAA